MATGMTQARTAGFASSGAARNAARAGWALLAGMLRARQTRRMLLEMDDRMLADIGIGRGDAQMEAARAAWDLGPRR